MASTPSAHDIAPTAFTVISSAPLVCPGFTSAVTPGTWWHQPAASV